METDTLDGCPVYRISRISRYTSMTRALVYGLGRIPPPAVASCDTLASLLLAVTQAARECAFPVTSIVDAMGASATDATRALFLEGVSCARLFIAVTQEHEPLALPVDHVFDWNSTPWWAECIQWWLRHGAFKAITPTPDDVPGMLRRFKKMAQQMSGLQWACANAHAATYRHGYATQDYTSLIRDVQQVAHDEFRWVFSAISHLKEATRYTDLERDLSCRETPVVDRVGDTSAGGARVDADPCDTLPVDYGGVNELSDDEAEHPVGCGQHARICIVEVGPCGAPDAAASTPKEVTIFVALASAVMKDEEQTGVCAFIESRSMNQNIPLRSRFLACALRGIVDAHKYGRSHANADILRDTLAVYWTTPDTRTYADAVSFGCPRLASPCLPTHWGTFAVRYQSEHAKLQWTRHTETLQTVVRITSGTRQ